MLDVPELVVQRAIANGATGRRWLADLPGVVDDLMVRWDLELGPGLDRSRQPA